MSYQVAHNIETVQSVASGLPDREYDPYLDDEREDDAPGDDEYPYALSVWDAVNGRWVDV